MRFSNGVWIMLDDVTPTYPVRVHDTERRDDSLTVHAANWPDTGRGSYISGTLFTIRLSSPMPDVLRVTVTHFAGAVRGPGFALEPEQDGAAPLEVEEDEVATRVTSGRLALEVARKGGFQMRFLGEGRRLTQSAPKALGLMKKGGHVYLREQLALGVGELMYGLGERFAAVVRNGQSIDTWNEDPGTASDLAYKNVPFYLTNRGYGVFVNHPGRVSFEMATERVNSAQFSVEGETLDYFLFYGPSPKEVLAKYTALTGRPARPPAWSFGLWLSTSFLTNYDEQTVSSYIEGMAERRLPLHVFHFDCFWMREYEWCNFAWDPRTFPDPTAMLARLKARGLKISLWINPYIGQKSPLFREGMENGYLLRRANGDVYQVDDWQPGLALVDFTNPHAVAWYQSKLRRLLGMGVDCFKTDFGERIPTAVVYADGSDPERMHNYYTYLYNRAVFELLEEHRGKGEALVFARSATAGSQKFPVHWGGDCSATFESMAETLRGGLSLGLSGFAYWSHDIGGFEQTATPALYKRWVAFGLLSSHSRLHGSGTPRVPWTFDDEAVDVLRFFTELKCRLMPYLYSVACEASATGVPVLRHMVLEFPDDPACLYLERQYMLGPSLLVAPVFAEDGIVEYYLPEGDWVHVISGITRSGGRFIREAIGFCDIPLYQRPGSIVPVGAITDRPDYDYGDGVELRIHGLRNGAELDVAIVDTAGAVGRRFRALRREDTVTVTATEPSPPSWNARLFGAVEVTHGHTFEGDGRSTVVAPDAGALSYNIR